MDKIDIHTGTLGKAFGGAVGGFTAGPKEVIDIDVYKRQVESKGAVNHLEPAEELIKRNKQS